jgi:hypothetical protein
MVKNIFFATALIWFGALAGQTCTPDKSLTKSGFLPAVLPPAVVNSYYNEGISVLTFRDTHTVQLGIKIPVKIDSIKVMRINGLPAGMNFKCQHPRCVFLWDTVRCISFYGTATQSGTYPLKIHVRAFAKVGGFTPQTQNDSITSYSLEVINGTASAWQPVSASFRISPNPANDYIMIDDDYANRKWMITDLSGRELPCSVLEKSAYQTKVSVNHLKPGLYIATDGERKNKFLVP